jgi:hypothetical protein
VLFPALTVGLLSRQEVTRNLRYPIRRSTFAVRAVSRGIEYLHFSLRQLLRDGI